MLSSHRVLSDMDNNGIGDGGLTALAQPLRQLASLQKLSLIENPIRDLGVYRLMFGDLDVSLMRTVPAEDQILLTLTHLRLDGTQVTDFTCEILEYAIKSGWLPALLELSIGDTTSIGNTTALKRCALNRVLRQSTASRPQLVDGEMAGDEVTTVLDARAKRVLYVMRELGATLTVRTMAAAGLMAKVFDFLCRFVGECDYDGLMAKVFDCLWRHRKLVLLLVLLVVVLCVLFVVYS